MRVFSTKFLIISVLKITFARNSIQLEISIENYLFQFFCPNYVKNYKTDNVPKSH